jgi:hypothetical protein
MDPAIQPTNQPVNQGAQAIPAGPPSLDVGPGASGVASPVPPGAPMTQSQMVSSLTEMMTKIQGKYQDFNARKFSSQNKVNEQQGEALRQIFDLFESNGVDPSNAGQVGAFLDQLKQANPELYQQFTAALQVILGDDTMASMTPPISNAPEVPPQAAPAVSPQEVSAPMPPVPGNESSDNMNINPNAQTVPQNV